MCDIVKQKRINMQVTKTLVYLFQIVVYLCQETNGDVSQCGGRTPAVRICKHSEVTMVTKVFIETAYVPPRQRNKCKCNVTPALLNSSVSLFYRKISRESKNVYFKFQDIILNKTEERANSTLTKENELVLETTSDFNTKDVCLIISTEGVLNSDDESKFNIFCEESQWAVTQSTVPEITISELKTSTNSTLENSSDVDICTIGIATGGIVCVIVELVAILIICYKRLIVFISRGSQETEEKCEDTKTITGRERNICKKRRR
ncbi:uncharacterized protein LOC132721927 isoform X2 [Ruditapes philippinarum]|uniref:uncharacterized protein LOC132721927 isoform X2 n=1 Tax=Ruditapes philippinarum TaxID=129788 RepID=UPI00295A8967|nr:uncharacterized protein LOC132721927 isoform X2 [Ruditapes philippinarum]